MRAALFYLFYPFWPKLNKEAMRMNIIRECIHLLSSKTVTIALQFLLPVFPNFNQDDQCCLFWKTLWDFLVPQRAAVCHADGAEHAQRSSFSCALICWFKEQSKRKRKNGVYVLCNFKKCHQLPWFISFMYFYCRSYCTTAALWLRGINYVRLYADYLLLWFVNNINSCALLTLAWLRLCLGPTNPAAASGKKI